MSWPEKVQTLCLPLKCLNNKFQVAPLGHQQQLQRYCQPNITRKLKVELKTTDNRCRPKQNLVGKKMSKCLLKSSHGPSALADPGVQLHVQPVQPTKISQGKPPVSWAKKVIHFSPPPPPPPPPATRGRRFGSPGFLERQLFGWMVDVVQLPIPGADSTSPTGAKGDQEGLFGATGFFSGTISRD